MEIVKRKYDENGKTWTEIHETVESQASKKMLDEAHASQKRHYLSMMSKYEALKVNPPKCNRCRKNRDVEVLQVLSALGMRPQEFSNPPRFVDCRCKDCRLLFRRPIE